MVHTSLPVQRAMIDYASMLHKSGMAVVYIYMMPASTYVHQYTTSQCYSRSAVILALSDAMCSGE
jgi:hypothetical protein